MIPTFKHLLQSETVKYKNNKSYYQQYDVKIMGAFHNQAMMKHKIYENILTRKMGMYYSPVIHFETIIVNMDEAKALTKSNQPEKSNAKQQKWCRCGSIKHLRITSNYFPSGISSQKAKNWPWGWGYLNLSQRSQENNRQCNNKEIFLR